MKSHIWLILLLCVVVAGCEGATNFHGTISVASEVAPASEAPLVLILNDDYRYPMSDQEGMWGSKEGGIYAGKLYAAQNGSQEVVFAPPTLTYEYWHREFAYYPSKVWLGVFIDENRNGVLDVGEPLGINPKNPLVDLPGGSKINVVRVDFTIDHRLAPAECVWLKMCAPSSN